MAIEIFNMEQGTPEWFQCRAGLASASEFSTILAKGKGGGESITRAKYMRRLAGERLTGEPEETFQSPVLERGHVMEVEAAEWFSFTREVELQQVGFIKSTECGGMGYSPDRLIGDNGLLEIKTNKPSVLIDYLLKDEFPSEYVAQCQGGLFVSGRDYIDLVCFWGKMPSKLVKRAIPDRAYQATLHSEITRFNDELCALVEKIKRYGQ
jgi:hypothetical protein